MGEMVHGCSNLRMTTWCEGDNEVIVVRGRCNTVEVKNHRPTRMEKVYIGDKLYWMCIAPPIHERVNMTRRWSETF